MDIRRDSDMGIDGLQYRLANHTDRTASDHFARSGDNHNDGYRTSYGYSHRCRGGNHGTPDGLCDPQSHRAPHPRP